MSNQLVAAACLVVALCACEPPCTPGDVSPMSNTVQAFRPQARLIAFNIEIGDCEPGHVPLPKARVVGPTGQVGRADVEIDQREADLLAGKWPRLAVGAVEARPAEPGPSVIELDFSTVTRRLSAEFVEVFDPPGQRELPAWCWAPLRIDGDSVVCSTGVSPDTSQVIEIRDGGTGSIGPGSRLWSTPEGYLLTSDGGIGWLGSGQTLGQWTPQASLTATALGVAANSTAVFILHSTEIEVRDRRDLTRLLARQPTSNGALLDRMHLVAASESSVQTSVTASHTSDAGSTVPTVTTEAFEWTDGGLRSQGVVDTWWEDHPIVAFGELLWTTDLRGGSLRAYRVGGAPLSMLVADLRSLGECSGPGDRPGCVAGGVLSANGVEGQFLQCPFLDDSGVRFVSVQLKSNEIGQCEGNLAYAGHPPFGSEADGDMRIIDLTALIPTAPYR